MSIVDYNAARRLGMVGLARRTMARFSSARNRFFNSRPGNARATSARQSAARSFNVARRRNRRISGQGVTSQHDRRHIYSKRRQPRFKRRRWGRFVKKVNAVSEKTLGSRTVVLNKLYTFANQDASLQLLGVAYLYSQKGTTTFQNGGDLNLVGALENTADPTAAAGISTYDSTKLLFQSAVLDLTIRNASTRIDTGPTTVSASEAKLEVDIYECSVARPTEETGATYNTFLSLLQDNVTGIAPIGGVGTELSYLQRGVTPFDTTYSLSRWGIKIWKKTKFFIPNNDTITYQVRDPRRRIVTRDDCVNQDGFNRPGWTRVIFIVGKLVAGLQVGATVGTYQEIINVGATRKYMYKMEGANDDRGSYITT